LIKQLFFLMLLIAANAFFAASEMALISLNDNKIKLMAEEGNKKAKQLLKLLGEPSRFLATIQIGITLAGFLASAFAAESFADPLVDWLNNYEIPFSDDFLKVTTVTIITVVLSYFTLVFGELVPKRVAMKKAESISYRVVGLLLILSKITNPFVKLLSASTNILVRLFGVDPHSLEDDVTEEEIRMMVDVGEEKGTIDEREKIMINNIFEFNNKTAEEIMTHRMELVGVPVTVELSTLMNRLAEERYSRIPVYDGSIDNVVGILHVKDLLALINVDSEINFKIEDYMRKPYFIPKQKKIDELFVDIQNAKTHMAIVIDEYGGTAGVVTVEDLVEEIMGNIFDEYDEEEDREIKKIDDFTYEASCRIGLDELDEILDAELPINDFDTLNGFLISLIGNIPPKGENVEIRFNHVRFQVIEVTEKRIEKAMIYVDEPKSFIETLLE